MSAPSLIALTGYAGSGKSTVAEYLESRHGYRRIRFADPLKDMLKAGFGLTDAHVNGALKGEVLPVLGGRTPREAMQTLGTEWGRDIIHPDLWILAWRARVEASDRGVVVEDLRFVNEANVVNRYGGEIWRIKRPGTRAGEHVSEREMDNIQPRALITNDGAVDELFPLIDYLLGINGPAAAQDAA